MHRRPRFPLGSKVAGTTITIMSDLFAANVPSEHVQAVLEGMRQAPQHTYLN